MLLAKKKFCLQVTCQKVFHCPGHPCKDACDKQNKITKITSKQLALNIIHTDDIINSIMILLNNNITSGTYCIKNTNNIKISQLIIMLNKVLNKKIKVKYGNKSITSNFYNNLKILPNWKPNKNLENKIIKTFKNETN